MRELGRDYLEVGAGFELPRVSGVPELSRIVARRAGAPAARASAPTLWRADFFALEDCSLFASLPPASREGVLAQLSFGLLEEALFIERAGMAYDAKMVLLAESCEERMLYSHFGAEEASHFAAVEALMGTDAREAQPTHFHRWLERGVVSGDRASLILVMQVVMEGWGIDHYRRMARGTHDADARATFMKILRDEAGHHGAGVASFRQCELGAREIELSVMLLRELFEMVRMGPFSVVEAIDAASGGLSGQQRAQLLDELDAENHVRSRMARLLQLITESGASEKLLAALSDEATELRGPS